MGRSVFPLRRWELGLGIAVGVLLALILAGLLLLSFGWGLLRPVAERRLSATLGRPVTIAQIRRTGGGLLHPVLEIGGVRIAQPAWAGPGDLLQLRTARLRLSAPALLTGRVRPELMALDGVRLWLVRREDGQGSWQREGIRKSAGTGMPDLARLVVHDAQVRFDDRRGQKDFRVAVTADAGGLRAAGRGTVAGLPATVDIAGAPIRPGAAWPFRLALRSRPVTILADGHMRAPFALDDFSASVRSNGRNLVDLDRLLQTGLFDTQPYDLRATVIRRDGNWTLRRMTGRVGRSTILADLVIGKRPDGRTALNGSLASSGFDFDDLANDAQLAEAAAKARRTGPRLIPPTRIDLSGVRRLDGELHVDLRRILSRKPTRFRSARGTLTLDHGTLTVAPLVATMTAGRLTGSAVVRHPDGVPLLHVDLRLTGGRIERLTDAQGVLAGPIAGHVRLTGRGITVREAMGRADGRIGIAAENGSMTRRIALFLGADVGRGLFQGNDARTGVRCIAAILPVRRGIARPAPVVIDTDVARADGRGSVRLADERIALDFAGAPKKQSLLQLNGPIEVRGTLEAPTFNPPPQTRTIGGVLGMVAKAIGGHNAPVARDAPCAALTAQALR